MFVEGNIDDLHIAGAATLKDVFVPEFIAAIISALMFGFSTFLSSFIIATVKSQAAFALDISLSTSSLPKWALFTFAVAE